jgi:phospholipid/cholesterol/gamma-HCH transport system ATP-binding protein
MSNGQWLFPMPLIELKHIHKRFGKLVVLNDLNLSIEAGKCIVIIGASGSGKSVLIKHIVGLLMPDQGEVWYDGKRIDEMSIRQLMETRVDFGFLFQMGALFDSLNVGQNIAFPIIEHTTDSSARISQIVDEKLSLVGLSGLEKKMPGELSGGQRKRVALARAIALNPKVILYDEPTTGLDPIRSDVINELIIKLQRELKVTSIVVTHDMNSAMKIADRIVMLYDGKIVFDGTPGQLQSSTEPKVKQFVSGEASDQDLQAIRSTPSPAQA